MDPSGSLSWNQVMLLLFLCGHSCLLQSVMLRVDSNQQLYYKQDNSNTVWIDGKSRVPAIAVLHWSCKASTLAVVAPSVVASVMKEECNFIENNPFLGYIF